MKLKASNLRKKKFTASIVAMFFVRRIRFPNFWSAGILHITLLNHAAETGTQRNQKLQVQHTRTRRHWRLLRHAQSGSCQRASDKNRLCRVRAVSRHVAPGESPWSPPLPFGFQPSKRRGPIKNVSSRCPISTYVGVGLVAGGLKRNRRQF